MRKSSGLPRRGLIEGHGIRKILSGVLVFDLLTKGGVPEGKISLFYGGPSSGKTTMAMKIMGMYLEDNLEARGCIVDFENAIDEVWGSKIIGCSSDRVDVVTPAFAEEGLEFLQDVLKTREYRFLIIDSLANIVSVSESEADADQELIGYSARTISKLLRRILPLHVDAERDGKPITIILINQVRTSIQRGPQYVNTFSLPGGKFQEFLASLIVRMYPKKVEEENELPTYANFSFLVEKNKCGGLPKVVGEYVLNLMTGEFINDGFFLSLVKELDLLTQENGKWKFLDEYYKTQKELKERIKDKAFYKAVIDLLIRRYYEKKQI